MSKRALPNTTSRITVYELQCTLLEKCKADVTYFLTIKSDLIEFFEKIYIRTIEDVEFPVATSELMPIITQYNLDCFDGKVIHFDLGGMGHFLFRYHLATTQGKWLVIKKVE